MTDIVESGVGPPARKAGLLIPIIATLILGGAGFASTFLGWWSPFQLLPAASAPVGVKSVFLDIIRAELATRIGAVLGDIPVRDLLITEFRIK